MIEFRQAQNDKRVTICLEKGLMVVEREKDITGIRINGQIEPIIVYGSYEETVRRLCFIDVSDATYDELTKDMCLLQVMAKDSGATHFNVRNTAGGFDTYEIGCLEYVGPGRRSEDLSIQCHDGANGFDNWEGTIEFIRRRES